MSGRPSAQVPRASAQVPRAPAQVPRVRKRPLQKKLQRKRQRLGNLPRRRADPGKSRNFLGNIMDMDILGTYLFAKLT